MYLTNTGQLYQMASHNAKSFNAQVYQKSYSRLKLNPIDQAIFQRLLGFLIRNDKPFPFSVVSLSELTGFSKRTIFRSLNTLENYRLIERVGLGKNRRFVRGSILRKIFTTVSNRTKIILCRYSTTVPDSHKKLTNRATVAYKKTSSSLKHKERINNSGNKIPYNPNYQEYVGHLKTEIALGLKPKNTKIMSYEEYKLLI